MSVYSKSFVHDVARCTTVRALAPRARWNQRGGALSAIHHPSQPSLSPLVSCFTSEYSPLPNKQLAMISRYLIQLVFPRVLGLRGACGGALAADDASELKVHGPEPLSEVVRLACPLLGEAALRSER